MLVLVVVGTALLGSAAPRASAAPRHKRLLVVGDSILAGVLANHALGELQTALPGWEVVFDAQADRSTAGGATAARAHDPASFDMVIVGLGANNGWSATVFTQQMRQMMATLQPVPRVYWLTVREVPRFAAEYRSVNAVIRGLADQYANLQAVDWNAFGAAHPEAFYGDGLHLAPAGGSEMAQFLASIVLGTNAYLVARGPNAVTTTSSTTTAPGSSTGRPVAAAPAAVGQGAEEATDSGGAVLWWVVGAGVVALLAAGFVVVRWRRLRVEQAAEAATRERHPSTIEEEPVGR